jgi:hypothetical protein
MDEKCLQGLVEIPKEKRPPVAPDNIKMDLKETGYEGVG